MMDFSPPKGPLDANGYILGAAGSYILCCLACGAEHFRGSSTGQGSPSWCVDCYFDGRSTEADGRVVAVHSADLPFWRRIWDHSETGGTLDLRRT